MSFKALLHHLNHRDTRLFPHFFSITKIIFIAVFALGSIFIIRQILAAETLIDYQKITTPSRETFLRGASNDTIFDMVNKIAGKLPIDDNGNLTENWTPNGGVLGTETKMIATLYTPPASGKEYIASVWGGFLGGKSAYAANGVGFDGLQPLLPIWKSFRDAVYALSAIIFVIIGVMIMLRVKISPQAVITAQSAIPQIITTLILVTFSYAIAGLLIDLSSVFQGIMISIIAPNSSGNIIASLLNLFSKVPIIGSVWPSFTNMVQPTILTTGFFLFMPTLATAMLGGIISSIIGVCLGSLGGPVGAVVGGLGLAAIGGVIIFLILLILICIWLVQFLIGLFKCYATVIFKIVIAPLEIGMGAFPNSKMNFSSWIWDLISNLAVFPISFLFMVLSSKIITLILVGGSITALSNFFTGSGASSAIWIPSMLGGDLSPAGLMAVGAIGLSTLMLLPKLPTMIPEFVFMIKPSPWGQAIGKSFSEIPGGKLATAAVQQTVHDRLYDASDPNNQNNKSTAQENALRAANVMEMMGWGKSRK